MMIASDIAVHYLDRANRQNITPNSEHLADRSEQDGACIRAMALHGE
jgi:hypothetical protein